MIYAPPKMTNDREVFEFVRDHLLGMTQPSADDNIGCVYRGDKGAKCALGCLIADVFYDDRMEGFGPPEPQVCDPIRQSIGYAPSTVLMRSLQALHDDDAMFDRRSELLNPEAWTFAPDGDFISCPPDVYRPED